MAIIYGGNPNGEFRGKMGGLIFSRNKGGQYVKAYAKPVDANTSAQINARTSFAQAISAFHTLTPAAKSGWSAFAAAYFASKRRGNQPGLHSGVNAFVSLRNILTNMARTKSTAVNLTIKVNGVAATLPTQSSNIVSNVAPMNTLEGVLNSGKYSITGVTALNYFHTTGKVNLKFDVAWNGSPTFPLPVAGIGSILQDGNGKNVGFAVYASNVLVQQGVAVSNPDLILLGNTGLIATYVTPSVVSASIEIDYIPTINQSGYKNWLVSASTYRLQLYMYNIEGQIIKIGERTAQIG